MKKISLILFLSVALTSYLLLELGCFPSIIKYLEFGIVVFCFLSAFINLLVKFDKKYLPIVIGLFFTVLADGGLVMRLYPNFQLIGMIFFCFTQLSYFAYLLINCNNRKINNANIICRASLTLILVIVIAIVNPSALLIVCAFYFANLICDIVFAYANFKENRLFAIGLTFFILCDIYVALGVGADMGIIDANANSFVHDFLCYPKLNMAWLFYVPSQVLIVLSTFKLKEIE